MLSLDEACIAIKNKFPNFIYFNGIAELPDKFIFSPLEEDGEEMDTPPYSVDKKTGAVNIYMPQENYIEFLRAKKEKYL